MPSQGRKCQLLGICRGDITSCKEGESMQRINEPTIHAGVAVTVNKWEDRPSVDTTQVVQWT